MGILNSRLKQENAILQRFVQRIISPDETENLLSVPTIHPVSHSSAISKRSLSPSTRRTRSGQLEKRQSLTSQEKYYIFFRELEELEKDLGANRLLLERKINQLKASLEGATLLLCEGKKDIAILERHCKPPIEKELTNSSDILNALKERVLHKQSLIGRMKLQNKFLEAQRRRLEKRFDEKEEVPLLVDRELLRLEIEENEVKLEEKNKEITRLQRRYQLLFLNTHQLKEKLADEKKKELQLERKVNRCQNKLFCLEKKRSNIKERRLECQSAVMDSDHIPDVMEHIRLKLDIARLEKCKKMWEGKVKNTHLKVTP